jgi:DNA (cytosine-5)-methyltransferase 1
MIQTLDLFAGAGGLSIGFHEAGFKTVAAVESDSYAAQTFAHHSPSTNVLNEDIQSVGLAIFRRKVDVVIGGPPCQPFSSGGRRDAHQDERDMIPAFLKSLELIQPNAFVMENVPGLTVGERFQYFGNVLHAMKSLGYTVEWRVVSAVDYGVPQKRRRLFIIGMRDQSFRFPKATYGPGTNRPHVTVSDVLPQHQVGDPNTAIVTYAKLPDLRPSPFDGLMFNGGGRPVDRQAPSHTILASAGGNKTHFFDDLDVVPAYHRHLLASGEPYVGTVPGARRLTTLESAILQTFPPETKFCGPRSAQYRQIGNAVPPLLSQVLARALAEQLEGQPASDDPRYHSSAAPALSF